MKEIEKQVYKNKLIKLGFKKTTKYDWEKIINDDIIIVSFDDYWDWTEDGKGGVLRPNDKSFSFENYEEFKIAYNETLKRNL